MPVTMEKLSKVVEFLAGIADRKRNVPTNGLMLLETATLRAEKNEGSFTTK